MVRAAVNKDLFCRLFTWKAHSSKTSNWKLFSISAFDVSCWRKSFLFLGWRFPPQRIENTLWHENCFPLSFQCIECLLSRLQGGVSSSATEVIHNSDLDFLPSLANPSKEQSVNFSNWLIFLRCSIRAERANLQSRLLITLLPKELLSNTL